MDAGVCTLLRGWGRRQGGPRARRVVNLVKDAKPRYKARSIKLFCGFLFFVLSHFSFVFLVCLLFLRVSASRAHGHGIRVPKPQHPPPPPASGFEDACLSIETPRATFFLRATHASPTKKGLGAGVRTPGDINK